MAGGAPKSKLKIAGSNITMGDLVQLGVGTSHGTGGGSSVKITDSTVTSSSSTVYVMAATGLSKGKLTIKNSTLDAGDGVDGAIAVLASTDFGYGRKGKITITDSTLDATGDTRSRSERRTARRP
jgi:hypothetical protein